MLFKLSARKLSKTSDKSLLYFFARLEHEIVNTHKVDSNIVLVTVASKQLYKRSCTALNKRFYYSVGDPDPSDLYVFGPPGSGFGSFYYQAKILFCDFFLTFYLRKLM